MKQFIQLVGMACGVVLIYAAGKILYCMADYREIYVQKSAQLEIAKMQLEYQARLVQACPQAMQQRAPERPEEIKKPEKPEAAKK